MGAAAQHARVVDRQTAHLLRAYCRGSGHAFSGRRIRIAVCAMVRQQLGLALGSASAFAEGSCASTAAARSSM